METGSVSFTESGSSSSPNSSSQLNSHKIYFDSLNKPAEPAGSSPSPRRKTRVAATLTIHGIQPPRCQVEGCKVDLSDAKAYHSRHKVCGLHSKSPLVIVGGIEQRFCQQCSRFHLLSEFDQAKRSCRRRLAGHNERRRKTPAASLLSSRFSHLSDNGYGPSFLTAYSSTPTVNLRECYNTDQPHSNCALSLLSNQQLWDSTQGVNYTTTMLLQHQHAPPPSVVNHHHFQGISSIGGSLPPGLGLDLFYADRVNLGSEGRRECSGLEPSRAFNSSTHTMH